METGNFSSIGTSEFFAEINTLLFCSFTWSELGAYNSYSWLISSSWSYEGYVCVYINKKVKNREGSEGYVEWFWYTVFTFFLIWILRFGAVACGVASELYVFGGVRSRDDSQASEMVTCKSEFYHDEFKR